MSILSVLKKRRLFHGLHPSRVGSMWLVTPVLVLSVEIVLAFVFWDWLNDNESASTTIRNIGLVIAGSVAFPLAIWRGIVADRQASAAQQQSDSARQSLLNERYQQGAGMLGNEVLSVRLGGIYTLRHLADEHPEQYHVQAMRLLCAFASHPTKGEELTVPPLRQDVDAVMSIIAARRRITHRP